MTYTVKRNSTDKVRPWAIVDDDNVAVAHVVCETEARNFALLPDLLTSLTELTDWCRENTSPLDQNSPHRLLVNALSVIRRASREKMRPLPNTIAALEKYDAGEKERDAAWELVETNEDVHECVVREQAAADKVRLAYWEDTKDINSRDAILGGMSIHAIRQMVKASRADNETA